MSREEASGTAAASAHRGSGEVSRVCFAPWEVLNLAPLQDCTCDHKRPLGLLTAQKEALCLCSVTSPGSQPGGRQDHTGAGPGVSHPQSNKGQGLPTLAEQQLTIRELF